MEKSTTEKKQSGGIEFVAFAGGLGGDGGSPECGTETIRGVAAASADGSTVSFVRTGRTQTDTAAENTAKTAVVPYAVTAAVFTAIGAAVGWFCAFVH